MCEMKYEYLLHTWGGFYNKEHQHSEESGYHYFDTEKERDDYLKKLKALEEKLNARHLVATLSEGYNTRTKTILHRVVKWDGKEYYSNYEMSPNYPYDVAKYHLENKWYLGFNDYPIGEDFDYDNNEVETIQEWITGAFDITYD
jgi:hypothetical protein